MPVVTEEAIVLTRYPFRERSAVVVLLTRHRGVIRALTRQAKGKAGGGSALEPLAQVTITLYLSPRRELATVNEVELRHSCMALAGRPAAWAAALVAAELALEFCPPGTSQEALFRLLERTVAWLEQGVDPRVVVGYALLWTLKLAGVLPEPSTCARCRTPLAEEQLVFVPTEGFCCAGHGAAGVSLSLASISFLHQALRRPADRLTAVPGPELVGLLRSLAQQFLEKPLRSLPVFERLQGATPGPC
ncbi:MAG: DNA repair protein RecO [Thermoanaerobaculum sp.]|nr:DNA repair protein RecO [Thermoanaerobaculum sp.]